MKINLTIDTEDIGSFLSRCLKSRRIRMISVMALAVIPLVVVAAVSKPYTFKDGDTISASQVNANFDAMVDGINAVQTNNATYRWAAFNTYDNANFGWLMGNDSNMYGGVNPSNWTDGNYTAQHMSSDKELLRTLFTNKGYAKKNANIWSEVFLMYSSTNGRVVAVLFRIKNSTSSNITWTPYWYYSSYTGWNEYAGVAVNGSNVATLTSNGTTAQSITIPANRVSTVIFTSTAGPPSHITSGIYMRGVQMGFYNNSLALPSGLSYVDDLDTASGDFSQ